MIDNKLFTILSIALLSQLSTVTSANPREFMNFGAPYENPPDISRTAAQLEADLAKESSQANTIDASVLAELDQTNQPVIRSFMDENGNNHTATYTKNPDGTITKQQSGTILINELNRNSNPVPGVGSVPIDELLQGTGVVNTVYTDDNIEQRSVYRLQMNNDETTGENFTPINTNEERTQATTPTRRQQIATTPRPQQIATTTRRTTIPATAMVNTGRQPTIAEEIFNDLNRILDSYWVKRNNEDTPELFRPTFLLPQEFFKIPAYVQNPNNFNFFDYFEELKQLTLGLNGAIKEVRFASDGKTIASVRYWPSNNLLLSRTPASITTIKTRGGHQIVTKAAQVLRANKVHIYIIDDLSVGIFVKGI